MIIKEYFTTKTGNLINSELLSDEILELVESGKPGLLQRKKLGGKILKRIEDFVETFNNRMTG